MLGVIQWLIKAATWIIEKIIVPVVKVMVKMVIAIVEFAVVSPAATVVAGVIAVGVGRLMKELPWFGTEDVLAKVFTTVGAGLIYSGLGSYAFGALGSAVGLGFLSRKVFQAIGASLGIGLAAYEFVTDERPFGIFSIASL